MFLSQLLIKNHNSQILNIGIQEDPSQYSILYFTTVLSSFKRSEHILEESYVLYSDIGSYQLFQTKDVEHGFVNEASINFPLKLMSYSIVHGISNENLLEAAQKKSLDFCSQSQTRNHLQNSEL